MAFDERRLRKTLQSIAATEGPPTRFVVGFSGGLDSTALLHALVDAELGRPILALHVDHQLQPDSDQWQQQAQRVAQRLGVDYRSIKAQVNTDSGDGPEAAARNARYAVFRSQLVDGDWLLCAQHLDDQAETLLLNLLRGSGPLGLAGMPLIRRLGAGHLVRPLLDLSRDELESYARASGLTWLSDPSNEDSGFDRNYLRHKVIPVLRERWPEASRRLARSAELSGDAQALLEDLAVSDLEAVAAVNPARIRLDALAELSDRRRRNLLRHACRAIGLPVPPADRLQTLLDTMLSAAADAEPLVTWAGAEARRYRGELFLLAASEAVFDAPAGSTIGRLGIGEPLSLGPGLGRLSLVATDGHGIPAELAEQGFDVTRRRGGESIRIRAGGRSQRLKKLLQAEGLLPWMRDFVPLVVAADQLIAVADLWVNADIATTPGYRVEWAGRPDLV